MVETAVNFIRDLMRKERETVGFLPMGEIVRRAALGRVELAYDNDDPCGYLVTGKGRNYLPIHQLCIAADARLIDHGRRLANAALQRAKAGQFWGLLVRCAADIPAVAFWEALGFATLATEHPRNKRGRAIRVMARPTEGGAFLPGCLPSFADCCPADIHEPPASPAKRFARRRWRGLGLFDETSVSESCS